MLDPYPDDMPDDELPIGLFPDEFKPVYDA